jgi:hypothetical protein
MISLLAAAGALFEMGCDDDGCAVKTPGGGKIRPWQGTRYTSPKPYRGRSDAIVAYHEEVEPEMGRVNQGGCDSTGCTYWLLARILIHNPTDKPVKADVGYTWYVNVNYKAGSNRIKNVPVPPKKTVAVELQQQFTATQSVKHTIAGQASVMILPGAP